MVFLGIKNHLLVFGTIVFLTLLSHQNDWWEKEEICSKDGAGN